MATMIQLQDVSFYRGSKCLLSNASFMAHAGWHIALIGRNGTGKSSLFGLLQGQFSQDGGDIRVPPVSNIAHMAQEVEALDSSALDYVLDGDFRLRELQQRLQSAEDADDAHAQAEIHQQLVDVDAYTASTRAAKLLAGLGFQQPDHERSVKSFSGGWRMRLNLAKTLMTPSQLLLLDEPTNHLDLDAIIWLEQWLRQYEGTLVLISHDREFVDATVDHVLHIEHQQLNYYRGNYSQYEQQRAARLAQQQAAYDKQQKEIAHAQSFITRFKAKASKAKQAQSRVKALERMTQIAPAHVDSPFHFRIKANEKISTPLLDLSHVNLGYQAADKTILHDLSLQLMPQMRIGLVGPNGAGKSTLIKTLAAELSPLSGTMTLGEHCYIGYFAQHQLDQLDLEASPLTSFRRMAPDTDEQTLRNFLGSFDFGGDSVDTPIKIFSGGEKARLALALIIWNKPNLLLLDEPTNHLDLDMRQALCLALQQYEGALVLVSHDRYLLRATTDEFYLVANGKAEAFNGDLDDYSVWLKEHRQQANTDEGSNSASQTSGERAKTDKKQERQAAAERRKKLAPLKKQLDKLEQQLAQRQAEQQAIEQQLAQPEAYEEGQKNQLKIWLERQAELSQDIETLENQWMELMESMEQQDAP